MDMKIGRVLVLLMENYNARIELGTERCYETITERNGFATLKRHGWYFMYFYLQSSIFRAWQIRNWNGYRMIHVAQTKKVS